MVAKLMWRQTVLGPGKQPMVAKAIGRKSSLSRSYQSGSNERKTTTLHVKLTHELGEWQCPSPIF